MSAAQNRFSETLSRADEVLLERTRRELAKMKAEDAAAEVEAVEQSPRDSFKRTEIASRYDDAFQAFGERVPMPGADKDRALKCGCTKLETPLPSNNEWAGVRADSVPSSAAAQIEQFMISAATAEGLRPSVANLPPDREIVRNRNRPHHRRTPHGVFREKVVRQTDGQTGQAGSENFESANWRDFDGTSDASRRDGGSLLAVLGLTSLRDAPCPTISDTTARDATASFSLKCRSLSSPKERDRQRPGQYPRSDRQPWRPQQDIPSRRMTKGEKAQRLLDSIVRQDQDVRAFMDASRRASWEQRKAREQVEA